LIIEVPVTTAGGLTLDNFKDAIVWWSTVDAEMIEMVSAAEEAVTAEENPPEPGVKV